MRRLVFRLVSLVGLIGIGLSCSPTEEVLVEAPREVSPRVKSTWGPANGLVDLSQPASVRGIVRFEGDVRPPKTIDMSMDTYCLEGDGAKTQVDDLVVDAQRGLRDVVVYIEGLDRHGAAFPAATDKPSLNQAGCFYVPHTVAARVGQEIRLVNQDTTTHMYHFIGRKNDEINRTQAGVVVDTLTFDRPEIGAIIMCDVHPWMRARIHLFRHPCFAVTSTDGSFHLKGIPPGHYRLRFWHERCGEQSQEITVAAGETIPVGTVKLTEG